MTALVRAAVLLAVLVMLAPRAGRAQTLYVAPRGNDQWSGRVAQPRADRRDGPLASLAGARDAIRRLRAAGRARGPIRVRFASGTYPMTEPVVFEPHDGGTAAAPVVYQAAPGAVPILSGGRPIQLHRDGARWSATLPEVAAGRWRVEQLWVNGLRAPRARTPNAGPLFVRAVVPTGDTTWGPDPTAAFRARHEDLAGIALGPDERPSDVNVVVYHSWETSRHRLAALDTAAATVVLARPPAWPFHFWGPNQRYYFENLRAALDTAGEWYLGRDGVLTYLPRPGEESSAPAVVAPVAEQLVVIRGTPERPVAYLTFRGLRFRYAQRLLEPEGHGDAQAAVTVPGAIQIDYATHILLDRLEVGHVGGYGVVFDHDCRHCRLTRTYLHDLGAGGARISTSDSNVIDNNVVRGGGRLYPGAVGIWIGRGAENRITHNDVSDLYASGISVGWTWGYGPSHSERNLIAYNRVQHVGQGMLSDIGGIYTLGRTGGGVIRGNVIHDVESFECYGRGGWGLYNDEGSSDILMEDNLVYDATTGPYHQHYGRGNVLRNNILAFGARGQLQRSRAEDSTALTVERNIVYWRDGALLAGVWDDPLVRLDHNLYWRAASADTALAAELRARQGRGADSGSIVVDPGFADATRRDFRLALDSPARRLGFTPFDTRRAGVYGDPAWVALARRVTDGGRPPPRPVDARSSALPDPSVCLP